MPTAYASRADLAALGLPPTVRSALTPAKQDQALSAAASKADSYLRRRYTLPLTVWGDDLRQAVCAIAAYEGLAGTGVEVTSDLRRRYDDALRWLDQVADEALHPDITDSAPDEQIDGPVFVSRPQRNPRRW